MIGGATSPTPRRLLRFFALLFVIFVAIGLLLPVLGKAKQWTGWMPYSQIREVGTYAQSAFRDQDRLPGENWAEVWADHTTGEVDPGNRYHPDRLRRHYLYVPPSLWREASYTGWPEGPGDFPMFYEHPGLVRFTTGVAYWDGESERLSDSEFEAMLTRLQDAAGEPFRPHESITLSEEEIDAWWGDYPYRP